MVVRLLQRKIIVVERNARSEQFYSRF